MALNEITFEINRYRKPKILSVKESLPKIVMHVLFMIPGTLPNSPTRGGDVFQYIYTVEDRLNEGKLERSLREALGDVVYDQHITSVKMKATPVDGGGDALLVMINLRSEKTKQQEALAMLVQNVDNHVHYNYEYISDQVGSF